MDQYKNITGLYLVTDTLTQDRFNHEELADMAIKGGVRIIQLRDKQLESGPLLQTAKRVVERCRQSGVISIINDRADIALAADADGVHLGRNDLPVDVVRTMIGSGKLIGGTASTVEEAIRVERQGADYVGFGHIFETATKKKEYPPRGVEVLKELKAAIEIPVVAIGGIREDNIGQVLETGADAVALSRAICAADNPEQAARRLSAHFP